MSTEKKEDPNSVSDMSTLLPQGTKVEVAEGITATVFPMGFKHIRKFSGQLAKILTVLVGTVDIKQLTSAAIGGKVLAQVLPIVFEEVFELVLDCVTFNVEGITVEDLPHWSAAPIVEAWVNESFGSKEKLLPWVGAIERTIAQATGRIPKEVSLSDMFSKD